MQFKEKVLFLMGSLLSVLLACSLESPLLWLRGDPELEYLAELNLIQPEHMWVGGCGHTYISEIFGLDVSNAIWHVDVL